LSLNEPFHESFPGFKGGYNILQFSGSWREEKLRVITVSEFGTYEFIYGVEGESMVLISTITIDNPEAICFKTGFCTF
jgi:hypothetical protein